MSALYFNPLPGTKLTGDAILTTITRRELAHSVAQGAGCTNFIATKMVDALFEFMRETLSQGNRIEIRGFGVLDVRDTKPKPAARNPRTGEIICVPARRKTHFKPGRHLKEAMDTPLQNVVE